LLNSKNTSSKSIYRLPCWATWWEPTQFSQVGWIEWNYTWIDDSSICTSGQAISQLFDLNHNLDPKKWSRTIANPTYCTTFIVYQIEIYDVKYYIWWMSLSQQEPGFGSSYCIPQDEKVARMVAHCNRTIYITQ
jgi:hypothetical protein